jgi:hypothetical protein
MCSGEVEIARSQVRFVGGLSNHRCEDSSTPGGVARPHTSFSSVQRTNSVPQMKRAVIIATEA